MEKGKENEGGPYREKLKLNAKQRYREKHGGVVVSTVTSQLEGSGFDSQLGPGAFLCGVCMFSPCLRWVLLVQRHVYRG